MQQRQHWCDTNKPTTTSPAPGGNSAIYGEGWGSSHTWQRLRSRNVGSLQCLKAQDYKCLECGIVFSHSYNVWGCIFCAMRVEKVPRTCTPVPPIPQTSQIRNGFTPLLRAIMCETANPSPSQTEVIRLLLANGARVDEDAHPIYRPFGSVLEIAAQRKRKLTKEAMGLLGTEWEKLKKKHLLLEQPNKEEEKKEEGDAENNKVSASSSSSSSEEKKKDEATDDNDGEGSGTILPPPPPISEIEEEEDEQEFLSMQQNVAKYRASCIRQQIEAAFLHFQKQDDNNNDKVVVEKKEDDVSSSCSSYDADIDVFVKEHTLALSEKSGELLFYSKTRDFVNVLHRKKTIKEGYFAICNYVEKHNPDHANHVLNALSYTNDALLYNIREWNILDLFSRMRSGVQKSDTVEQQTKLDTLLFQEEVNAAQKQNVRGSVEWQLSIYDLACKSLMQRPLTQMLAHENAHLLNTFAMIASGFFQILISYYLEKEIEKRDVVVETEWAENVTKYAEEKAAKKKDNATPKTIPRRVPPSSLLQQQQQLCEECKCEIHSDRDMFSVEWDDSSDGGRDILCKGCFQTLYVCSSERCKEKLRSDRIMNRVYFRPSRNECQVGCCEFGQFD